MGQHGGCKQVVVVASTSWVHQALFWVAYMCLGRDIMGVEKMRKLLANNVWTKHKYPVH